MAKKKAIYTESYGCACNKSDIEIIQGLLTKAGHRIVKNPKEADIQIINTCAVKDATQRRMLHRISSMQGKPLIISGCLPKIDLNSIHKVNPDYFAVVDPQSIEKIPSIIEHEDKRNLRYISERAPLKPKLPKVRLNPLIEIIQIAEGCLGNCTYCCTRFARGSLQSFPVELIKERVRQATSDGAIEIWLTAQDTGAYGKDHGIDLIDLLTELIHLKNEFRVRIGMMNPNFAIKMISDLSRILNNPRFYKFLHIPVQSGSNKILEEMNRHYKAEEFIKMVDTLRSEIPDVTLSTDIIVGYPTETDEDFQLTIELLNKTRPDIINISRYGSRPNTIASQLTPKQTKIVLLRSKIASEISSKITLENNKRMIGRREQITLIDNTRLGKPIGRTLNYKKIIFNQGEMTLGTKVLATITAAYERYLEGSITSNANIEHVYY